MHYRIETAEISVCQHGFLTYYKFGAGCEYIFETAVRVEPCDNALGSSISGCLEITDADVVLLVANGLADHLVVNPGRANLIVLVSPGNNIDSFELFIVDAEGRAEGALLLSGGLWRLPRDEVGHKPDNDEENDDDDGCDGDGNDVLLLRAIIVSF